MIPVCDSMCIAKLDFLRYVLPHCVHLCWNSVWLMWCEFSSRLVLYLQIKRTMFSIVTEAVQVGQKPTPVHKCRICVAVDRSARSNGLPKNWHVWTPFRKAHKCTFLFLNAQFKQFYRSLKSIWILELTLFWFDMLLHVEFHEPIVFEAAKKWNGYF